MPKKTAHRKPPKGFTFPADLPKPLTAAQMAKKLGLTRSELAKIRRWVAKIDPSKR